MYASVIFDDQSEDGDSWLSNSILLSSSSDDDDDVPVCRRMRLERRWFVDFLPSPLSSSASEEGFFRESKTNGGFFPFHLSHSACVFFTFPVTIGFGSRNIDRLSDAISTVVAKPGVRPGWTSQGRLMTLTVVELLALCTLKEISVHFTDTTKISVFVVRGRDGELIASRGWTVHWHVVLLGRGSLLLSPFGCGSGSTGRTIPQIRRGVARRSEWDS